MRFALTFFCAMNMENVINSLLCAIALALAIVSCSDNPEPEWIALDQVDTVIVPGVHGGIDDAPLFNQYRMPLFRREFTASKDIVSASAKVCGLGHFEMYVNGEKAGNHFLDPGWTDYAKEALYVEFDVTGMLKKGDNVIDVMLGNGFYNIPNERYVKSVGSFGQPKLWLSLDIAYAGGRHEKIVTDCVSWKVTPSPVIFSSIYGGETYDARLEDEYFWQVPVEAPTDIALIPQDGTELKIYCELPEACHFRNEAGEWIYDFGQNFSGIVRLGVRGPRGAEVQLWPAELLEADLDIEQGHSGSPYHWDYILKGSASTETWQPRFTFYGQRYVKVVGAVPDGADNPDGLPEIVELTGLHTTSAPDEAGTFECGEELFNRTHRLIDWAIRSNLQSVITDCPHREKLGWLEQAHLMQNSMQYRYDMHKHYRKILRDMESSQRADGCIPTTAPEFVAFSGEFEDTPEWGSAFVICPWYAYLWYGDVSLISEHYPAMCRYIEYLSGRADNNIVAYGLGDWYDIGPEDPGYSQLTGNGVTATSIYYYDVVLMSKMAAVLGRDDDAARFTALAAEIKKSFNEKYYDSAHGYYDRNSQTANAMPLYVGLVEEQDRDKVLGSLVAEIKGRDFALTAGDVGYRYVLQTLQEAGLGDVIYRMNCRSDVPGYGWQLAHGATSLTESWQAYSNVSNNHLMLGHIMEWFYGGLCGIRQTGESVAFRHLLIKPQVVPEVGYAKASLKLDSGTVSTGWKISADGGITLDLTVPEGSDARVLVPGYGIDETVSSGTYSFTGKQLCNTSLSGCREHPFEPQVLSYDGNKVAHTYVFDGSSLNADGAGSWSVDVDRKKVSGESDDFVVTFTVQEGEMPSGGAAVQFEFDDWSTGNYVFAPCYLYNGNRFRSLPIGYPPFIYDEEDRPLDMPVTVTNIPRLATDGRNSYVDFKTNSSATPLAGFYDSNAKRGFFILTDEKGSLDNDAFFISEYPSQGRLTIRLSSPGVREHRYYMCNADNPSDDCGKALKPGDEIKMHFRVYDFHCEDLMAYFDKYLSIRKDLSGRNEYRNLEPFSSIRSTIIAHHFADKWYEDDKVAYDSNNPHGDSRFGHLQLAWNGPPALSLMQLLNPHPEQEEALRRIGRTFDSMVYMQGESGLFRGILMKGEFFGDDFATCDQGKRDISMVLRTGMTVYYALQCFDLLRLQGRGDFIKPEWERSIRKACDALCTLYDRYGEFGQMVYACTGDMHTPNSSASVLSIGALAYASVYFDEPAYLALAEKAGDYYYENHLAKGYVGGGAAEILQCPDSESSSELAESYIALFEITRDEKWLKCACDAAAYFSTWVVSYDYKFPESSIFGRHDIKAAGSVWASVQNEHSAPGIYVLSGDFLLKLYRHTGDRRYLELDKDMTHNIVQYVNTGNNRIQSGGGFGYVTERVNIGDWEGAEGIGCIPQNDSNIAWGNCTMLHTTLNPGIYVTPDNGELMVFDHVDARIVSSDADSVTLEITNPTYRDGDISVLAESSVYARENSLGWNGPFFWPKVHVPSGGTVTVTLPIRNRCE